MTKITVEFSFIILGAKKLSVTAQMIERELENFGSTFFKQPLQHTIESIRLSE